MSDNVYQKENVALPCHKYLVRRIECEADKLEYARAFFTKLYEQGYDTREIISRYVATAHFQETNHFDFLSYQDKALSGESFYNTIMTDSSITTYKNCQVYAKKYEKDIIPVCKICLACSRYANKNREKELSVLKKLNASYDSLQLFLSKSNASFFKCCTDIVESTPASTPLVIPLYRFCFNVIKSCGASYYDQGILNMSDSQRLSMLQNRMFAELKKKYEIDTRMPNYIHLFPLVYSSLVDEIERAADITDTDLEAFITLRRGAEPIKQGYPTGSERENVCNRPTVSLPLIDADAFLLNGKAQCMDQINKPEHVSATKDTHHEDLGFPHSPVSDIEAQISSNTDNSHSLTDLAAVLNEIEFPNYKDNFTDNLQADQPDTGLRTTTKYHASHTTDSSSSKMEPSETLAMTNAIPPKDFPAVAPILAGDIPLPCVSRHRLIDNITPVGNENIKLVTPAVIKDGNLPLECIIDDHGNYAIVFWVCSLEQFFFSHFMNMHEDIKELLSHKRIRKICYQPYYLYSLCKIHDMQIKHVYSFHSVHLHILNPDTNLSYRGMVELYTGNKCFDQPISALRELTEFMCGIRYYQIIHRVQANLIASDGNNTSYLEDMKNIDEILGISYLRSLNFHDDSTLFSFESGQLHFNRYINKNAKRAGFLLTYVIENDNIDRNIKMKIYLSLLCDLSRTGRVRKMNIQLMTLYDDTMILFLGAAEHEFLTTYIFVHINKIGQKYGCAELNVTVSHERCISE